MIIGDFETHPASDLFPLLPPQELEELANDIKINGLLAPIVLTQDDKILDGRNRLMACVKACVTPRFELWSGDDPVSWVLSVNLHRRHLDESQRAIVGAKAKSMFEAAAAERKAATQFGDTVSANLRSPEAPRKAAEEAAALVNVSPRSVESASKVLRSGAAELVTAVESGQASVSAAADVAELPREEQREIVAKGERAILQAAKEIRAKKAEKLREARIEKIADISKNNLPLNSELGARVPVLYADPPWRYEFSSDEADCIENKYPTMDLDAIKALPVADVTTDDCILFLWVTSPKLQEGMEVLQAWGFTYRTCAVWDKQHMGMGYYFRQQHELLLVATRGQIPAPSPGARPASVISVKKTEHSAKPDVVYEIIERMYPELPKLEMFCRRPREGWQTWGNQACK